MNKCKLAGINLSRAMLEENVKMTAKQNKYLTGILEQWYSNFELSKEQFKTIQDIVTGKLDLIVSLIRKKKLDHLIPSLAYFKPRRRNYSGMNLKQMNKSEVDDDIF